MLQSSFKNSFIKKGLQHRCLSVNIAKFLRTLFLQNTSGGCSCLVLREASIFLRIVFFKLISVILEEVGGFRGSH